MYCILLRCSYSDIHFAVGLVPQNSKWELLKAKRGATTRRYSRMVLLPMCADPAVFIVLGIALNPNTALAASSAAAFRITRGQGRPCCASVHPRRTGAASDRRGAFEAEGRTG
jgi:hypothetical protein